MKVIKMNQKVKSLGMPRRTKYNNFVFTVFLENGDIAVMFNENYYPPFREGDTITYRLTESKKYFEPKLELINPKQTLNK